jgi:hypothetical protein
MDYAGRAPDFDWLAMQHYRTIPVCCLRPIPKLPPGFKVTRITVTALRRARWSIDRPLTLNTKRQLERLLLLLAGICVAAT